MKKGNKKPQRFSHEDLEENLYLRITEYGVKHPKGFTYSGILRNRTLNLKRNEKSIVEKYLHSAYINAHETKTRGRSGNSETPFLLIEQPSGNAHSDDANKYTISFDAHFKYIDYLELKDARKHARQAKTLAIIAIVITTIGIGGSFYFQNRSIQASNKNLQIAIDPQITVYPQDRPQNPLFIQVDNSTIQLTLKNKFIGTLDNIKIYRNYILLVQDIYNYDYWTCDYTGNINPIATTTSLDSGEEYSFSFSYSSAYNEAQSYRQGVKEYTNSASFIRVRVDFEKKESSEPYSRYFFYKVSGNNNLQNYNDSYLPTDVSTEYGPMRGQEIINIIKESYFSVDKRCFL